MVSFKKKITKNWRIILIFILSFLVTWPLFVKGYFSHQDDLQIIRLFEMRKCFSDFQIPCRWVPDMGWGNGFPLFNFYGVFTYYVGGLLSYFFGFIVTSKILFYFSLIGGSFGIYYLIKKIWGENAALVSAIFYMFAPYKALDVYVRGALSESFALSLFPFVLLFIYKLAISKKFSKKTFVLSTLFLFFFLTTHNIMTVVFTPVLFSWSVYWLFVNKWKNTKVILMSLFFSFGLSMFFLLPAFSEKSLVQEDSLTRFELDYRANFVSVKKLFLDRVWGYGTSIPGPEGGMSFQIGWPYWMLAFISPIFMFLKKIKRKEKILIFSIFATFLLSIFMTHNKSTIIWETFEILKYFQFPWRFLSLSVLTSSFLAGFIIYVLPKKYQSVSAIIFVFFAVILNWKYFKPREFYKITDEEKSSGELWEIQRKGAILDYLPKTALEPRESAPETPLSITGEASLSNYQVFSNKWKFEVSAEKRSEIEIPIYYFPNWKVYVNGKEYPFNYDNLLGRIRIKLDSGEYKVEGKFKNTSIRTIANALSLLSVLGLIIYVKKR